MTTGEPHEQRNAAGGPPAATGNKLATQPEVDGRRTCSRSDCGSWLVSFCTATPINEFLVRLVVLQAACHIKDEGGKFLSTSLGAAYTIAGDAMVAALLDFQSRCQPADMQ